MEQKLGFMGVLFIFAVFVVPLLVQTFDGHVKGGKVLNVSTELQQMISAEGGVTPAVTTAIDKLNAKGYVVDITSSNGSTTGVLPVGTKVEIEVSLDDYETKSYVTVNKRTSMLLIKEKAVFV